MSDDTNATLVEQVRTRYAGAARAVLHQLHSPVIRAVKPAGS